MGIEAQSDSGQELVREVHEPLPTKPVRGINREEREEGGKDGKWESLPLFAFSVLSFLVWLGVDRIGGFPVSSPPKEERSPGPLSVDPVLESYTLASGGSRSLAPF